MSALTPNDAAPRRGGRPRLGEGESVRLQMVISTEELGAIDAWRYRNRVPSRSQAIRSLCLKAIAFEQEEQTSARGSLSNAEGAGGVSPPAPLASKSHSLSPPVLCQTASTPEAETPPVSGVTNSNDPVAAAEVTGDYLREPMAAASGQIIREGDAPRETDCHAGEASQGGSDASGPDTEYRTHAGLRHQQISIGEA